MTHLAQGFGFDLTNAFAGDFELAAYFFQRAAVAVHQAEALFEHLPFAFGEGVQDVLDLLFEEHDRGHVGRVLSALVFDEIAEAGVVAVAHGGLQRDGLLRHLEHGADAFDGKLDFLGDLFRVRLATVFLDELLLHAHQFVDRLDHVHRDTNGAGLIGDGTGDGLANPPSGVGGEFVTATVFKFLDCLHEAHVAFLDQVKEGEAAVGVFLRDGNHEAQVGFDHFGLGFERFAQP